MKAWLFDTESGLYAGEIFEEAAMLQYEDGLTVIPPPAYEYGEVPVFDRCKNDWVVIPVSVARQLLKIGDRKATEKP